MKGEKLVKRSSFGSMVRKRLSDITNTQSEPKFPKQDEMLPEVSASERDYIEQLVKDNATLAKLLADRNKIIELTGAELQKLRVNMQTLQLQNWNLAQSNSHILAELNIGREKLKALQHEVVCKDALLKAKKLKKEEGEAAGESLNHANNNNKPRNPNRGRPRRSQSLAPSTTSQQVSGKEGVENKRRCLRRQSAKFEARGQEPSEKLFEIEDAKFPVGHLISNAMHEDGAPLGTSVRKEGKEENCAPRSSIGRPLRRAVEKVQSYKEAAVNIKMRRPE